MRNMLKAAELVSLTLWMCKYLWPGGTVILLDHIQRVQVWDWLEGVKSHQGAPSVGVKHLQPVPGLQALQHCQRKGIISKDLFMLTWLNIIRQRKQSKVAQAIMVQHSLRINNRDLCWMEGVKPKIYETAGSQHHIPACITFLSSCDMALFVTCCWGDWVDVGEVIISVELVFVSKEGLSFCLQWIIQGRLRRRDFLDLHAEKWCGLQNIMYRKVFHHHTAGHTTSNFSSKRKSWRFSF